MHGKKHGAESPHGSRASSETWVRVSAHPRPPEAGILAGQPHAPASEHHEVAASESPLAPAIGVSEGGTSGVSGGGTSDQGIHVGSGTLSHAGMGLHDGGAGTSLGGRQESFASSLGDFDFEAQLRASEPPPPTGEAGSTSGSARPSGSSAGEFDFESQLRASEPPPPMRAAGHHMNEEDVQQTPSGEFNNRGLLHCLASSVPQGENALASR